MQKFFNVFGFLSCLLFCGCYENKSIGEKQNIIPFQRNNDKVYIVLSEHVKLFWDNKNSEIIKDSLYRMVKRNFGQYVKEITTQVSDTRITPAQSCGVERNLVMGDLAFLLIDDIVGIPYFSALGFQWDTFDTDCKYPLHMFGSLELYRPEIKSKLELYLNSSEGKKKISGMNTMGSF